MRTRRRERRPSQRTGAVSATGRRVGRLPRRCLGATITGNLPKNNTAAASRAASSTIQDAVAARLKFEGSWNRLHTVRTLASVVVLSIAMMTQPRKNIPPTAAADTAAYARRDPTVGSTAFRVDD